MYYKPGWPLARQRLVAFWKNEIIDRCCVAVLAPRNSVAARPTPHEPQSPDMARLADPEENYKNQIARFESTYFGGEALPCTYINRPVPIDHNQVIAVVKYFLEKNKGDFFIGAAEHGSAGDILSLTKGAEKFSTDLIDNSESVKKDIDKIADSWISYNEEFYKLTSRANDNGGISPWLALWAPGKTAMPACDFSIGISPKHFREFFVPEITKEARWCEFATYHLDGVRALNAHLDTLLAIEEIDSIQWSPGNSLLLENIAQYKKIQKAGRRLYLFAKPQEIEPLLAELSAKGLFISTQADSQQQADELLKNVAKWSKVR